MMAISSPLSTAANNIVKLGNQTERVLPKTQKEFQDFSRFLQIEIVKLEKIQLPTTRKVKELGNINVSNSFGSIGNLLKNLLGGGMDLANFITGMFPGKGEKVGGKAAPGKAQPKPGMRGGKLNISAGRALPIVNTIFAGLDFATGLAEGESVGKAAAGAGGALAGSLLGGAIGQALIPIPGLGFVIGSAIGGSIGGYGADRVYEAASGEGTQEQKIKEQEQKQKSAAKRDVTSNLSFSEVLMKFGEAVSKFEDFSLNIGSVMGMGEDTNNPYDEPAEYPDFPEDSPDGVYEGPVDGNTFFPLPGGDVGTRGNISPGQAFGAPRENGRRHKGLDMTHHVGALEAPVVAYKTGKVIWSSGSGSYDSGLMIDHGDGIKTKYFHITPLVKTGDVVYGGQQIAKLFPAGGNTHLHFEVHKQGNPINPLNAGVGPGGSARRLPLPLSVEKAKENSKTGSAKADMQSQSSGIKIYPPGVSQQTQKPTSSVSQAQPSSQQTSGSQSRPITQALPQSVMTASQRPERQIQTYPSYSQGQSYIVERETIITGGGGGGSRQPAVIPVGGGGSGQAIVITPETGSLVLNSLMKSILLTSLSST